jgi:hypothetical protein
MEAGKSKCDRWMQKVPFVTKCILVGDSLRSVWVGACGRLDG